MEKQKEEEDKSTENSEIIKHDQIKDNIGESDNQSQWNLTKIIIFPLNIFRTVFIK